MGNHLLEFEQLVLLALARLEDNGYGLAIRDTLARHGGREASVAAVYKSLWRLESRGLVASRDGDPTSRRGGRRKRLYRLTTPGRHALRASLASLRNLAHGVEGLAIE